MSKFLFPALFILFAGHHQVYSYKPVVIIHGILDTAASLNDLKSMIEKAHPSTNVTVIKLYPETKSIFTPMWEQVDGVSKILKKIMAESENGIHLIGFSQGIKFHFRGISFFKEVKRMSSPDLYQHHSPQSFKCHDYCHSLSFEISRPACRAALQSKQHPSRPVL
jgi:hypothetical protein